MGLPFWNAYSKIRTIASWGRGSQFFSLYAVLFSTNNEEASDEDEDESDTSEDEQQESTKEGTELTETPEDASEKFKDD